MFQITENLSKVFTMGCQSDCSVLITGPTGTGKSTLARMIHERSNRSSHPFVTVNLATLHEGTLESELFGHEKGSFTGADLKRTGRIESAQGGTVFLDEVGELSPRLQARLLDFLQSHTISPIGSNREIQLDVRVIAATHKNLNSEIKEGKFREDLFHRLRIIEIPLKPLIERLDEFDEIIHTCLDSICKRKGKTILRIQPEVAAKFESYTWPGNIRELKNVLEYAVMASENDQIALHDLPQWIFEEQLLNLKQNQQIDAVLGVAEFQLSLDYYGTFSRIESEYLRRALIRNRGRISRTAQQIGLNKATLQRKVSLYNLK